MADAKSQLRRAPDFALETAGGTAAGLAPASRRAVVNLRGAVEDRDFAKAVEDVVGAALPDAANRWSGDDGTAIIWLGPDEWLVMAPQGHAHAIEAGLRAACGDDPWMSVVDLTHTYTGFVLTGTKARNVIAKGCSLDLHPRGFSHGDCAQTLLAKSRVLMRAIDEGSSIEIWVRNSFARYLATWLIDAMEEFKHQAAWE